MKARHTAWHCDCRTPLGPYRLNHAHLVRCLVCGVARYSDPAVGANTKVAPSPSASIEARSTVRHR
jgi:hypothetical protein